MKVVFDKMGDYREELPSAIALGTFDGIHTGHQELVRRLQERKRTQGLQSIIYTFTNHPLSKLAPHMVPPQLMLLKEKIRIFSKLNLDLLILNAFNERFYHQSPEEFVNSLVARYPLRTLVVGYNFKYGYKGSGDTKLLQEMADKLNFELVVVNPVVQDGEVISSSRIRELIGEGHVAQAARHLGRPYSITGKIIHGYGRGRTLGFPTANLAFSPRKVLPKYGVYLTKCRIAGNGYWGLTNFGSNPTFSAEKSHMETYLLNFTGNIYDAPLKIMFMEWLRDEFRFSSSSELTAQIHQDVQCAKNLIYKLNEV